MPGTGEAVNEPQNHEEHNIREGSLGFGAVAMNEGVVAYTVVPADSPLLLEDQTVVRYDESMLLVSGALPTRPSRDAGPNTKTQTQAVRDFVQGEQAQLRFDQAA